MYSYTTVRNFPYTAHQMFLLVKDVEAYPAFLPWCKALNIIHSQDEQILADMVIGFKKIQEKFTSKVTFNEGKREIVVQYEKGPFKHLSTVWNFTECTEGCSVSFYVEFSFRNFLVDIALKPSFAQIVKKMIFAFETRAKEVYGQQKSIEVYGKEKRI